MSAVRLMAGMCLFAVLLVSSSVGALAASVPLLGRGDNSLKRVESEIRTEEKRLRRIEAKLARERDREAKSDLRRNSILARLDRLSARLALEDQRLRLLGQKLRRSKMRQAEIRAKIDQVRELQNGRKNILHRRLRALYMGGAVGNVRLLVMSESVWDMMDRWSMVTRMARHDEQLLDQFRRTEERLNRLDEAASIEVKRQAAIQAGRSKAKRRVVVYYGRRTRELARLEKNKARRARLMRELEEARDAMRDTIASLLKAKDTQFDREAAQIDRMEGRLPWPVAGAPLSADRKRGSRGIRIRAPRGAPVRPVAPGEVVYLDWVRGYGRLLILRHGGGIYTVYGGAGEVFVDMGSKVAPKQIIARVGTTGALGGSALYFEIRRGSIPMEPLRWLLPRR